MPERKVIVFDGICVLCSAWVRFVLARDHRREFYFAAMQGVTGPELLARYGINPDDPVTFLLIDSGMGYTDTDAALRIISRFGVFWNTVAHLAGLIPRALRNRLYRWIARHRYRLFGVRDVCLLPTASEADRFLH